MKDVSKSSSSSQEGEGEMEGGEETGSRSTEAKTEREERGSLCGGVNDAEVYGHDHEEAIDEE
jgi:hypothetical protein